MEKEGKHCESKGKTFRDERGGAQQGSIYEKESVEREKKGR